MTGKTKRHAYCFGHCNRQQRRACKLDCGRSKAENPVDQSLIDLETFYNTLAKLGRGMNWNVFNSILENDADMRYGLDLIKLWVYALQEAPPTWTEVAYPWEYKLLFTKWSLDGEWYREKKDAAVAAGLDSMLEAYYAGVPAEDIIA